MRVTNYKRIAKEDFSAEMQEDMEKLASSINPFADQIIQAFNGNIGFDNLNQELVTFEVQVNDKGKPSTQVEVKSNLKGKVQGYVVIRVEPVNHSDLPTATPFVSYKLTNTGTSIDAVTGLVKDKKYRITAIAIG